MNNNQSRFRENHTDNKQILYQLESLIRGLYPEHRTINPYHNYLESYYEELVIEDVLLFKRLLQSVTIINHKERPQQGKRYLSSYGDVLMAIELLSNYTINDKVMNYFVQLKEVFGDRPFTKLQAKRVLRKSESSLKRYMKIWEHLKLIEKTDIKQGLKATFVLKSYQADYSNEPIDELFTDFENYQGFINLQERT